MTEQDAPTFVLPDGSKLAPPYILSTYEQFHASIAEASPEGEIPDIFHVMMLQAYHAGYAKGALTTAAICKSEGGMTVLDAFTNGIKTEMACLSETNKQFAQDHGLPGGVAKF